MVKKCASMMFVLVLTLGSIAFADGTNLSARYQMTPKSLRCVPR